VTRYQAERVVAPGAPAVDLAERAVERLTEISQDLLGCAVLGPGGELLAASGDPERWGDGAAALVAAADSAGERPAERVHVATGDGEVFAVRRGELTMVAVAKRFTLASLMVFDMRTVLRELESGRHD
jgi:predicted regulator of Ras-like GTPase activity (Roadblock/LC7/MglB family)